MKIGPGACPALPALQKSPNRRIIGERMEELSMDMAEKTEEKTETKAGTSTLESLARSRKGDLHMKVIATEPKVLVTLEDWRTDEILTFSVEGSALKEIGRRPGKKPKKDEGCCEDLGDMYD